MKSERRHELKTNDLGEWLSQRIEVIAPYTNLILIAVVAVIVGGAVALFLSNERSARLTAAWTDYFSASSQDDPARLRTVAEAHAGTLPGLWAMQSEADIELARGIQALYTDRSTSREALDRAKKIYEQVASNTESQGLLRQGALFGLAQAHECSNDLDEARNYYEQVVKSAPESALGEEAEVRLARLNDADTVAWLQWFAKQKPRPAASAADGISGLNLPADLRELSDRPDLSVPEGGASPLFGPGTSPGAAPVEGGASSPQDGDSPPADEPQADGGDEPSEPATSADPETPEATEKPADAEKPAAEDSANEKPAEEKPAEETTPESPSEEPPASEPPASESPAEEPATAEPPAESAPAAEATPDEASAEGEPGEEGTSEETPVEESSPDGARAEESTTDSDSSGSSTR